MAMEVKIFIDIEMPMAREVKITGTETRCGSWVQGECFMFGDNEIVEAINPINFQVDWVIVQKLTLVEVVIFSLLWNVQGVSYSWGNIYAMAMGA